MKSHIQYTLGISSFFHDSSAALIANGKILAAAQEERFSRVKHDSSFPLESIKFCLNSAGTSPAELGAVVYFEKPLLKFERILSSHLYSAPKSFPSFLKGIPQWLERKLYVEQHIDRALNNQYEGAIHYCSHHQSHAASAFFPSPFKDAAIITFDGVGEWSTTTWGAGHDHQVKLNEEIRFPHSLGLLYSAFTQYLGFKVNSGEYKVMGLAPYGRPRFVQTILDNLIDLKEDGSFSLSLNYFDYIGGLSMISSSFMKLFSKPPRLPESEIKQFHMDVAASVQKVTEEVMLKIARHVRQQTGSKNLCLAGGVALNCVGNGKILEEKIFDQMWIQPASGDAGGALGAALYHWHTQQNNPREVQKKDSQKGSLLGPSYSNEFIKEFLQSINIKAVFFEDSQLFEKIAEKIAKGQVIGFFQGPMEFGPRALGSRSILADPRSREMQKNLNIKIKKRESFRPFAPSCLREDKNIFFEIPCESPYMSLVTQVKDSQNLPAITHVDGSSRLQTVCLDRYPRFYKLLKEFKKQTGVGVLINTSFNVRGEPIVRTPQEAFACFMNTEIDILVLENYFIEKSELKTKPITPIATFALD